MLVALKFCAVSGSASACHPTAPGVKRVKLSQAARRSQGVEGVEGVEGVPTTGSHAPSPAVGWSGTAAGERERER